MRRSSLRGRSDVAFIVLLAGTGLPGDEIMMMQAKLIGKVMGADDKDLDKQERDAKASFRHHESRDRSQESQRLLRKELKKLLGDLSPGEQKAVGDLIRLPILR